MRRLSLCLLALLWATIAFADSINVGPTATGTAATGQIPGTATNDSAAAGKVGEYLTANLTGGSAVNITPSGTAVNATSIALTAGDWDVGGTVCFRPGATTNVTVLQGSVSSTTATIDFTAGNFAQVATAGTVLSTDNCIVVPTVRFSTAGTPTIFLVASGTFTVSTLGGYGGIRARRVR